MRHARVKFDGVGCYHVVSRTVDRVFRLDDREKDRFKEVLRQVEAFCGLRVLTYVAMSNHFHLLVEVPEPAVICEAELVRRMTVLYGQAYVDGVQAQWAEWRRSGSASLVDKQQATLWQRTGDISPFMKTLKQRISMSYNSRHGRRGTFWEDRYKSVLVEDAESVKATVAAYIDLNPVRAGLVDDPREYRWSGYGEACRGGKAARGGLGALYGAQGPEHADDWRSVARRYRDLLCLPEEMGGARVGRKRAGDAESVLAAGGKLSLQQALRCRVRYFTDGMAIGGKDFVDQVFGDNRHCFSPKRKDGARKMRFAEWGNLRTARALRIAPVRAPLVT